MGLFLIMVLIYNLALKMKFVFFLFLILSCSNPDYTNKKGPRVSQIGNGDSQTLSPTLPVETTAPEVQEEVLGENSSFPMPQATIKKLKQNPLHQNVYSAFKQQLDLIKDLGMPFGDKFVAHDPVEAGYSEGYFSNQTFLDPIARPLIPSNFSSTCSEDIYDSLYSSRNNGESLSWDPKNIERVSGYTFGGFKMPPAVLEQNHGLWSNLFSSSQKSNDKRRFQEAIEKDEEISLLSFDLSSHLYFTRLSLFVSTSRSIHAARHFALSTGSEGNSVEEGYVYAFYVENGFDTFDCNFISTKTGTSGEQEISVSGVIPWAHIVGYRKIKRNPHGDGTSPAEFVGSVYLREGLKEKDPQAFQKILHEFSIKSKLTEDFEKGIPWNRDIFDSRVFGKDYVREFREQYKDKLNRYYSRKN